MKLTKSKLREMIKEELLSEGANMRYKLMDKLVKTMGNHKKALEELFKTMSDKEAKDNVEYILRMWS